MNNLSPEQEQKSRDEFEEHFKTFGARFDLNSDGHYEAQYVQAMWASWKARHKTICVELPDIIRFSINNGAIMSVIDIIEALQAAGIGVNHD